MWDLKMAKLMIATMRLLVRVCVAGARGLRVALCRGIGRSWDAVRGVGQTVPMGCLPCLIRFL